MPRTSVHKTSAAEVLVTDALRTGPDSFLVAVRWPRNHLLHHRPEATGTDPLLLVETVRQAAIHLSHRFHGVPEGFPFVMFDLDFAAALPAQPGAGTAVLETTLTRIGGTARFRMAMETTVHVAGQVRGRGSVRWEALEPRTYGLLRRRGATTSADPVPAATPVPLPPEAVGCLQQQDVLLARRPDAPGDGWLLRTDRSHPVLFDHACDHIPGTVLVEAFRQAAGLAVPGAAAQPPATPWSPVRGRVAFASFAELHLPVHITARSAPGSAAVLLSAVQADRVVASAELAGPAPATRGEHSAGAAC
ncbi:ScbA/BarX family gamma-butyrolactone biosynthesis protein [Peterkaempfera griseoplana]|uniref:ScbA/BarX family gamma-butyrolactone biosynthesis protein n=1 Tax=Peterkaempfera griseoplana TaxID=66896 RepID=UPI00147005BE|nr:ScbA/BarX family gamma-butyrolactone biosynthesis protein [Peterkaempfera griseoplana]